MTSFAHGRQSISAAPADSLLLHNLTFISAPKLCRRTPLVDGLARVGPNGNQGYCAGYGLGSGAYSGGVQVKTDQNFGNGVLTPIADEIVVPPDSDGRFSFTPSSQRAFSRAT